MTFITVLGRMVSKDTISAEGKILTPVYWDKPRMQELGYFLLQKFKNYYCVKEYIPVCRSVSR